MLIKAYRLLIRYRGFESHSLRHSENEAVGSPATRARHPAKGVKSAMILPELNSFDCLFINFRTVDDGDNINNLHFDFKNHAVIANAQLAITFEAAAKWLAIQIWPCC